MRAEVFEPAGMSNSGFFAIDEVRPHVAAGYVPPSDSGREWTSNVFSVPAVGAPDGGAFCTAADLDAFLSAFRRGRLVDASMVRTMLQVHAVDDEGFAYGYGVWLIGAGEDVCFGTPARTPGPAPGRGAIRERDINVVVLATISEAAGAADRLIEGCLSDV